MAATPEWFKADKAGLGQLAERRGKAYIAAELLSNCWDENVSNITLQFNKRVTDNKWVITITDDAPDGFADLRDAYTLFTPSKKKGDANVRGRFNLGEKLVLALASEATITSTKGTVVFDAEGRRTTRHKRPTGTCFQGVFPTLTKADVDESVALCRRLLPPAGVTTIVSVGPDRFLI